MRFRTGLVICLLLFLVAANIGATNLLNDPECVVFDSLYNRYLVSCWSDGKIVAIDTAGNQSLFKAGLGRVLGNTIAGNTFYVSQGPRVIGIDLADTQIVMNVTIPGETQADGMAADTSGYLYVTASFSNSVFRINLETHTVEPFAISGVAEFPQDVIFDARHNRLLCCGARTNSPIQEISLADGTVTDLVITPMGFFDGLAMDNDGYIYVSCWGDDNIYRYDSTLTNPPDYITTLPGGPTNLCYNRRDDILAVGVWDADTVYFLSKIGGPIIQDPIFSDATYGDGDGILESGETIELTFTVKHSGIYDIACADVQLTVDDGALHISDGSTSLGSIGEKGIVTNAGDPLVFEIPPGYIPRLCNFTLTLDGDGDFGQEADTLQSSRQIGSPHILLVNDDTGDSAEVYIGASFDRLRVPYDIIPADPLPEITAFNGYDLVIWFTGNYQADPISLDEKALLETYMDGGGHLFLTGQGIAAQASLFGWTDFLNNYLKADFVSTSYYPLLVSVSGGIALNLADTVIVGGVGGADNQDSPDHVLPINGGVAELRYMTSEDYGAVSYDGAYRLLFFAFGFEAIPHNPYRWAEVDTVLAQILAFFDCPRPLSPMTLTISPGEPMHMVDHEPTIGWNYANSGFSQSEYHVQVGTDDDWTAAEMWDAGPVNGTETEAVYAGTTLADGTAYYFRVKISDGVNWTNWYYGDFRMNTAPTAPDDLTPTDMVEIEELSPELSAACAVDADGDALTYMFEVFDDDQLTSPVVQSPEIAGSIGGRILWQVSSALADGEDYFWRVCAGDAYETGPWSTTASFSIAPRYICGDANGDGIVNVGDAVFLINFVFKGGLEPPSLAAANVNGDEIINVGDVVYLINFIFKDGLDPNCP